MKYYLINSVKLNNISNIAEMTQTINAEAPPISVNDFISSMTKLVDETTKSLVENDNQTKVLLEDLDRLIQLERDKKKDLESHINHVQELMKRLNGQFNTLFLTQNE